MRAALQQRVQQRRRVLQCISLTHLGHSWIEDRAWIRANQGRPFRIKATQPLLFTFEERLRPATSDSLAVYGYEYTLLTASEREILAFHLHPGRGPHLHFGAGAGELFEPLYKAHVPTGPVSLAEVVLMLVRDFGVEPLRADWETVLEAERRD